MVWQIPRRVPPGTTPKGAFWAIAETLGRSIPDAGDAEGKLDPGSVVVSRLYAYDAVDSVKICGIVSGWIHQGKSAIHLAQACGEQKCNFMGQHFWAKGYFAPAIGRDATAIGEYVKNGEMEHSGCSN